MTSVHRALLLVSASSVLVPVVGLVTAPVLANVLGAAGRGQSAAAAAPLLVLSAAGSLGLPQAVTYYVAQGRRLSSSVVAAVVGITVVIGVASTVGIAAARGYLSDADPLLADLIVVGGVFVTPALLVGLLRGRAAGLQRWNEVAAEKALTTLVRAVTIVGLAATGGLDLLTAVLAVCLSPVIGGMTYLPGLRPSARRRASVSVPIHAPPARLGGLLRFGSSVWMGSVATMLMARINEIFLIPLSDATQLGLLVVAVTISDIPWIVTQALRDVLFGASSRTMDSKVLTQASRICSAGAALLCVGVAVTLPWWLVPVFGGDFARALWPTNLLLLGACAAVPGLIAGAALEASGRPHVRSLTLVASLVLDGALVFALVPEFGAVGAAAAVVVATLFASVVSVVLAGRELGVPASRFVGLTRADVRLLGAAPATVRRAVNTRRKEQHIS
ncbi:lipopolysaccharide biosynthesis protein [Actinomycetospora atypica]|uniref:Lipopolysaccharide biosynthesis protein n=1 Tax=Actinomycetospora atypica TaxID=1290095 RepID=A0ABV9YJA9_9PSEU